jgi:hypothetical protein
MAARFESKFHYSKTKGFIKQTKRKGRKKPVQKKLYAPHKEKRGSVIRGTVRVRRSRGDIGVCLGPVLASRDPSPPAAAEAAWRGRVPIEGWRYVRVGPERGLRGGGRRGWCEEWARRG